MSKRELLAAALDTTGLGWLLRRLGSWNGLLVLNYHRIGDGARSRWDDDLFSASAEAFDAQLRFLVHHLDVIGSGDLAEVLRRPRGRFAQITFDDGYRDNYEIAYPILRRRGISATFFVTTAFLDERPVPWWDELAWMVRGAPPARLRGGERCDRLAVARSLNRAYGSLGLAAAREPGLDGGQGFLDAIGAATGTGRCPASEGNALWLTWEMVREMRRAGMTIGGHTVHHAELSRLPRADQLAEITGCKARIEAELGEPIDSFSYPYGRATSFDATTRACVAEAGFRFAYSYHGGFQPPGSADPLDLKRVAVETFHSQELVMAIATLPNVLA